MVSKTISLGSNPSTLANSLPCPMETSVEKVGERKDKAYVREGLALIQRSSTNGTQRMCRIAPSLDRIDSNKGYTPDNIWVISKLANRMKNDASLYEIGRFGKWALSL